MRPEAGKAEAVVQVNILIALFFELPKLTPTHTDTDTTQAYIRVFFKNIQKYQPSKRKCKRRKKILFQ